MGLTYVKFKGGYINRQSLSEVRNTEESHTCYTPVSYTLVTYLLHCYKTFTPLLHYFNALHSYHYFCQLDTFLIGEEQREGGTEEEDRGHFLEFNIFI